MAREVEVLNKAFMKPGLTTGTGFLFFGLKEGKRAPKCDVIKNEICEIMGFVKLF